MDVSPGYFNPKHNESRNKYSLENFSIEKKIGNGQFSMVYKAKCMSTNIDVALKNVHIFEMMDSKEKLDCLKEIDILKELNHPNVIQYVASFIEDNKLFIVLELADGGDLAQLISFFISHQRLFGEKTIWKYFSELCASVQHMHNKRIMHRDIKPANVFFTAKGIVKLGDLGLGRYFSSKTNDVYTLVGTPYYMSPERILGKSYDFKSDIWSLGCLLYEMAALQSPFFSKNISLDSLSKKVKYCDYAPIPSDKYTIELYNSVEKCIQSDPEKRPDINYLLGYSQQMRNFFFDANFPSTSGGQLLLRTADKTSLNLCCIKLND